MIRLIAVVVALVGFSSPAVAQDPVKVDSAHHKVELENAQVRVLRITLDPGAKTPVHEHPLNSSNLQPFYAGSCHPMLEFDAINGGLCRTSLTQMSEFAVSIPPEPPALGVRFPRPKMPLMPGEAVAVTN